MDNERYPSQFAAELQQHIQQLTRLADALSTAIATEC